MTFRIRLAVPTDASSLPVVDQDAAQVFGSVEGLEWLADEEGGEGRTYLELIEAQTVWVAEAEQGVCGFLASRIEVRELHVVEVSVRRERQRRGIASALIQRAGDEARRLSLTALTLTTFRDLPWNEPFYAKLGFVRLEGAQLSERLEQQLGRDAAAGLPRHRRCAMRLCL